MTRKKQLTLTEFARMSGKARVAKLGPEKVKEPMQKAQQAAQGKRSNMTDVERE